MENITLKTFEEICINAKNFKDALSKVKQINNVPKEISEEFYVKYGKYKGKFLSTEESFKIFYKDSKCKAL